MTTNQIQDEKALADYQNAQKCINWKGTLLPARPIEETTWYGSSQYQPDTVTPKLTYTIGDGDYYDTVTHWTYTEYFTDFDSGFLRLGIPTNSKPEDRVKGFKFCLFNLQDGIRDNEHAIDSNMLIMDFDEGQSIASIRNLFRQFTHIIYTSKSHQIPAHDKPACDRFRILLPVDRAITQDEMKEIGIALSNRYGCDPSCFKGASWFWCGIPTSEIYRNFGKVLSTDWLLSLASSVTVPGCDISDSKTARVKGNGTINPLP